MTHDDHAPRAREQGSAAPPRRVVLTGGPGAGKTAVLEVVRRSFCAHVGVAPESASILFTGGFPREPSTPAQCAAQRAIFRVQVELEALFGARPGLELVLCDRGTIDGLAYWPGTPDTFFEELGTTHALQLARYDAVIHLEPPAANHGYHRNGVRIETAAQAATIDARILSAWSPHPRRYSVGSTKHFVDKVARVIEIIEGELPPACRAWRTGASASCA